MKSAVAGRISFESGAARPVRIPLWVTLGVSVFLFVTVGLFRIWSRVEIVSQGYALERERKVREDIFLEKRALLLQVERMRDPSRLEELARNAALTPPQPGQVVLMRGVP